MDIPINIKVFIKTIFGEGLEKIKEKLSFGKEAVQQKELLKTKEVIEWLKHQKELEQSLRILGSSYQRIQNFVANIKNLEELRNISTLTKALAYLKQEEDIKKKIRDITNEMKREETERLNTILKSTQIQREVTKQIKPYQRELIQIGLPARQVLGIIPFQERTEEDITRMKLITGIINENLKSKFKTKELETILVGLGKQDLDNLYRMYSYQQAAEKFAKSILRTEKERQSEIQRITTGVSGLTKEQEKELNLINRKEKLIIRINALRTEPKINEFIQKELKGQEDLNKLSINQLNILLERAKAIRTQESLLYRHRLEWDRLGNTIRFLGIQLTGVWLSGLRSASYFIIEVLRATGALDLTSKQAISLNLIARTLGFTLTDLTETINNIYQALINAGQGTSFVAARYREALRSVGIEYYSLGKQMEKPYDLFWKTILALKGLEATMGRAWVAQRLLGNQYEKIAPLLNLTTEEINNLRKTSEEYTENLGLDVKEISKSYIEFGLLVEQLRNFFVKFWSDVLISSKSFFSNLINILKEISNIFKVLPNSVKSFSAYLFVALGPGSYALGSVIRFYDNIQRLRLEFPQLISNIKLLITTLTGLISAHPIFSIIVASLTAIGIISKKIVSDIQSQKSEQEKWAQSMEESLRSYSNALKTIEIAQKQGFKIQNTTLANLKQDYLTLLKASSDYRKGLITQEQVLTVFDKQGKKIRKLTQEATKYLITLNFSKPTVEDINKKLEEAKIQIKENNLGLKEQFNIYDEIYQLSLNSELKEEERNKILEKRASIINDIWNEFNKVEKEVLKPTEEIPFIKTYIEGLNKIKELESYLPIIFKTKGVENYNKAFSIINEYRKRLNKQYSKEFQEEQLKNLQETLDLDIKLGKFSIEKYYKEKEILERIYGKKLIDLQRETEETITELRKKGAKRDDLIQLHQMFLNKKELLEKEYQVKIIDLEKKAVDDRISLMNLDLNKFEILVKEKSLGIQEINALYSEQINIIKKTIEELNKIPDTEYKRQKITELSSLLKEKEIEQLNKVKELQEKIFSEFKKSIDEEINRFNLRARTYEETLSFYVKLKNKIIENKQLTLEQTKLLLEEIKEKENQTSKEIIENKAKILNELLQLDFLSHRQRLDLLEKFLGLENIAYQKGLITYKDLTKNSIDVISNLFNRVLKENLQRSPLEPMETNITQTLNSIQKHLTNFTENINRLTPEEKLLLFSQILNNMFEQIREQKLSDTEINNIFNSNSFRKELINLGKIFGLSFYEINLILKKFKTNFSSESTRITELINSLTNEVKELLKGISETLLNSFYPLSIKIEQSLIKINEIIYQYLVEGFIEKLNIKEKLKAFTSDLLNSLDFRSFNLRLSSEIQTIVSGLKIFVQSIQDFFSGIVLQKEILQLKVNLFDEIINAFKEFSKNILISGQDFNTALNNLKTIIANALINFIVQTILIQKLFTQEFMIKLSQAIDFALKGNYKYLSSLINDFGKKVSLFIPVVQNIMRTITNALGITLQSTKENITKTVTNSIEEIKGSVSSGFNNIQSVFYIPGFSPVGSSLPVSSAPVPVLPTPTTITNKTLSVNFHGLSFNEQRKVFDLWQDKQELSKILGV